MENSNINKPHKENATRQRPHSAPPPLALAYIGDAVYELRVREHLLNGDHGIKTADAKMTSLHSRAVEYVNAERQSRLFSEIENLLSEEELAVFRHGRNAKSGRQPPHVAVAAYRRATGLEALIGHLHLAGKNERLDELFAILFSEDEVYD